MSGTSKQRKQGRNARPRVDGERSQQSGPGSEIGYGNPPEHKRFVKGRSGNPRGRPRKTKARAIQLADAPFDSFMETEAYRPLALRENGQAIELPMVQAVIRAAARDALLGKRHAQKYFLDLVAQTEVRRQNEKIELYNLFRDIKRLGEQRIAAYEARGLAPPKLLPHPRDIILNPVTLEVAIDGPMTEEQEPMYDHAVELRDYFLLLSANAERLDRTPLVEVEGKICCLYLMVGFLLDRALPKRYRWKDDIHVILLLTKYNRLTRRQREQRIVSERARLVDTTDRH
jgi:hypothetical protein